MFDSLHKSLSQYVMLPLFWRLKGVPVRPYYLEFRSQQRSSANEFKRRQSGRLKEVIEHAICSVAFYKRFNTPEFRTLLSTDPNGCLRQLPIVGKQDYRENFQAFQSDEPIRFLKNSSGGSTGEPVVIHQDLRYQASSLAATECIFEWAGCEAGDSLVKLWGAERDFIKGSYGLKQRLADFIGHRTTINAFDMNPTRMYDYVALINSKQPVCLEGYAESLYSLSCFIDENQLRVSSVNSIVSSAGTLLPHMRTKIESVFSTLVFDRYGCREVGNIASECAYHDGLHVFGDTTIVEVLDEDNDEVLPGQQGRVVATNLFNRTMPLLRYEIGDFAIRGEDDCNCNLAYPKLEKIIGRSSAIFRTRDGGYVLPEFFIHLIGVVYNDGEIVKFQVIQEDEETIVVRIVLEAGRDLQSWPKRDELSDLIAKAMKGPVDVIFKQETEIEPTPTGKFLYTVSRI